VDVRGLAPAAEDEDSPFREGRLPFTGSELLGLVLFAMIALGGGLGFRLVTRRLAQH
jgi:hypothetical protein